MTPELHRVIYCSRGDIARDPSRARGELQRILAISRKNNAAAGLSGALIFANGNFAQVLEGPRAALEARFERIQGDPRHHDIKVLEFTAVAAREFPDWSMAFAGDLRANQQDPLAFVVLAGAYAHRASGSSAAVLGLLHGLVQREDIWSFA